MKPFLIAQVYLIPTASPTAAHQEEPLIIIILHYRPHVYIPQRPLHTTTHFATLFVSRHC